MVQGGLSPPKTSQPRRSPGLVLVYYAIQVLPDLEADSSVEGHSRHWHCSIWLEFCTSFLRPFQIKGLYTGLCSLDISLLILLVLHLLQWESGLYGFSPFLAVPAWDLVYPEFVYAESIFPSNWIDGCGLLKLAASLSTWAHLSTCATSE
jgi:hypothetical protein